MRKKLLSLVLALAMALSVCACGNESTNAKTSESQVSKESTVTSETATQPVEDTGITFPLAEEVTFDVIVPGDGVKLAEIEKVPFWKELYEQTNVKINWIPVAKDTFMETVNAMFTSGQEGDVILSASVKIKEADLSVMAANGLLLPLNEYLDDAELMPNFNERIIAESPQTKGFITCPDGKIYAAPRYSALEGSYLESPMWINKTWLDKLGKKVPATIEELEEVLTLFAENDMNGNGADDEIPYIFRPADGSAHLEALLGLWGIPTKNGTNENFLYIKNGEVIFAPTQEAYKDYIKTLNRWYEKGILWSEGFTANKETYTAKVGSTDLIVGMYTYPTPPNNNYDDYVCITPVDVKGYETSWYIHPGIQGVKGSVCLTRSCENADIFMKWLDMWYSFENTIRIQYGEATDGRYDVVDGKISPKTLSSDEKKALNESKPTVAYCLDNGHYPYCYTSEDYAERMILSETETSKQENYALYKEYLTTEIWPRPYIAAEDSSRIAELRTDIFNTVNLKNAAWITGDADIDAEWDAYVQSLNKIGLDEFVKIHQGVYDVYLESNK